MRLKLSFSIIFLSFLVQLVSCSDDSEDSTPLVTLTTNSITTITSNSASAGGIITSVAESVTEFGVVYSESPTPTTSNKSVKATSTALGPFTLQITGLTSNTTYFVRGYATNSAGTAYGNEVSFTTLAELPTLTTTDVSEITSSTANGGGVITADGNADITARGVVWGTATEPTIDLSTKTSDGTGSGSYTSLIVDLEAGTEYFVRAYATNSAGTAYGNEVSFTTSSDLPILSTAEITAITSGTASGGGEVKSEGISEVTARGIVWDVATAPTVDLDTKTTDGAGLGVYESLISDLEPGTEYFVRAYATNSLGTSYGNELSFITEAELPTISTSEVTDITTTTATGGGEITSDGNGDITERGIVWGVTTAPTIDLSTKTTDGIGMGSFTSSITSLVKETTYFVRAYATNSAGTSYGNEVSFTTGSDLPTLTTSEISEITSTTASGGGEIISEGSSEVTARGIVWGESSSPTIELTTKTFNGTGIGSFTSSITSLTSGTTYFVRAYATNSTGTAYGNEVSFTANVELPIVSTSAISAITTTTATGGGNITSDGNGDITARGLVWSVSTSPTISLSTKTNNGAGTGTFESSLTGLMPETQYFVRAYATNSAGTAYGNEVIFTTLIDKSIPTVTTTSITAVGVTTATGGGGVTSDGNANVTARGIVWSTSTDPTINLNTKTVNGTGTGAFTSSITGLNANTRYYVRAYATNSEGTAYGSTVSFITSIALGTPLSGGVVGYVYQSGDPGYISGENHGIIIALSDQSSGANLSTAYSLCNNLVTGGFSDWRLPDADDLKYFCDNKGVLNAALNSNGGSGFVNSDYWSSDVYDGLGPYYINFNGCSYYVDDANNGSGSLRVRAVRFF